MACSSVLPLETGRSPKISHNTKPRVTSSPKLFSEALDRVCASLSDLTGAVGYLSAAHDDEVAILLKGSDNPGAEVALASEADIATGVPPSETETSHLRETRRISSSSRQSSASSADGRQPQHDLANHRSLTDESALSLISVIPEHHVATDGRNGNMNKVDRFDGLCALPGELNKPVSTACSEVDVQSQSAHVSDRYRSHGRKSLPTQPRASSKSHDSQGPVSPKSTCIRTEFALRREWCQEQHSRIVQYWQREIDVVITPRQNKIINSSGAYTSENRYRDNSVRRRSVLAVSLDDSSEEEPRACRLADFVLHPSGCIRLVWNGISLITIAYDMFMIPLLAFDIGEGGVFSAISVLFTSFWACDLLLNFRTGYFVGTQLEMRPRNIALHYARTWLLADLIIVATDFLGRFLSQIGTASLMRSSRLFRTMRFVRLVRLAKLKDLWKALQEQINSNVITLCFRICIMAMFTMIVIHIVTCVWFMIGKASSDGWPTYDAFEGKKDTLFWYTASARWAIAQLNGRTDMDDRRSMVERGFTCVAGVGMAVIAKALFTSVLTKTMLDLSDLRSEKNRRRRIVNEYLDRHHLSGPFVANLKRCLNDYQDAGKEQRNEEEVLAVLPRYMKASLLFEVRAPLMQRHVLFSAINQISRAALRHICRSAVRPFATVNGEVIFDKFDPCSRIILVTDGVLAYGHPKQSALSCDADDYNGDVTAEESEHTPKQNMAAILHDAVVLRGYNAVSEAALWVSWFNQGRLVTESVSTCFGIEATDLAETITTHHDAFGGSVVYARSFIKHFATLEKPTDLSTFDVKILPSTTASEYRLRVQVVSARALRQADRFSKSDPFCVCQVRGGRRSFYSASRAHGRRSSQSFKTPTVQDNCDPKWDCTGEVDCRHGQIIDFKVYDADFGGPDEFLGQTEIMVTAVISNGGFEGELALVGDGSTGHLCVKVTVVSATGADSFEAE
eukprot:TRINITY_DN43208_c0_g1_i1.p1 TRINITY_DN43208_c0_g1~~TRINITY_DN43208_c0_g1_i1.p1  ORF type:complete len:962 (-),score=102.49 TRINITY_DN43208_c0_g1_i1:11-2896(-)